MTDTAYTTQIETFENQIDAALAAGDTAEADRLITERREFRLNRGPSPWVEFDLDDPANEDFDLNQLAREDEDKYGPNPR